MKKTYSQWENKTTKKKIIHDLQICSKIIDKDISSHRREIIRGGHMEHQEQRTKERGDIR